MEKVILQLETGFYARPASELVKVASRFSSDIKLIKDGIEFNAKSIMGLLSIGAAKGDEFTIVAEGVDAKDAVENIKDIISNNL